MSALGPRSVGAHQRSSTQAGARRSAAQKSSNAHWQRERTVRVCAGTLAPGDTVLVAGATGGVGQLITAKLLERGYKVRAVARSSKASILSSYGCEIVVADLREASQVAPLLEGVQAVVNATGTTAFPSSRWDGNNGPRPTDLVASGNLINASKGKQLSRFVLVTSAGVERQSTFPFSLLNSFGVLKYKRESELLLQCTGLPYTILRPGRLTDGPYTSYDLNTLLKATSGNRQDVQVSPTDSLNGETSRIVVAEAVVQSLLTKEAEGKTISLASTPGEGPGQDGSKWQALFASVPPAVVSPALLQNA